MGAVATRRRRGRILLVAGAVVGGRRVGDDLLFGRETRRHGDLDVLVLRRDLPVIRAELRDWDVHAADPPGSLRPWPIGETLPARVHDVWCRRRATSAWAFQFVIDDNDGDDWLFRRDHRIRRPIHSLAGRASSANLAVLTPDVQLLYKSRGRRDKDVADFRAVQPYLSTGERNWLRSSLDVVSPGHVWASELAGG